MELHKQRQGKAPLKDVQRFAYSVAEVATGLGCSQRFVWKEIHEEQLAHIRLGRRVVVTPQQLATYLASNTPKVNS
jgi:excisionase family DNA binding protein